MSMPERKRTCVVYFVVVILAFTCSVGEGLEYSHEIVQLGGGSWVSIDGVETTTGYNICKNLRYSPVRLEFSITNGSPLPYGYTECNNKPYSLIWLENSSPLDIGIISGPRATATPPITPLWDDCGNGEWSVGGCQGNKVNDGTLIYTDWIPGAGFSVSAATTCIEKEITVHYEASIDGYNWQDTEQTVKVTFLESPPHLTAPEYISVGEEVDMDLTVEGIPWDESKNATFTYDDKLVKIYKNGVEIPSGGTIPVLTTDILFELRLRGIAVGKSTIEVNVDGLKGTSVVTVAGVDMELEGVSPDAEVDPGGTIPFGAVLALTIHEVQPSSAWPAVDLSTQTSGEGRVALYQDREATMPLYTHIFYPSAGHPVTVYVKGTHASSESKDVTLRLGHTNSSAHDEINVTVLNEGEVAIGRIIKSGSKPEQKGTLYVGVDGSVSLSAIPVPETSSFTSAVQWSVSGPDGAEPNCSPDPHDNASAMLSDLSVAGPYNVTATYGRSSAHIRVNVEDHVIVDRVVEANTQSEGPVQVATGVEVDLEAKPSGGDFASGQPDWKIEQKPGGTPTLSDESGPTRTVRNLSVPGKYSVRAYCDDFDFGDSIEINVIDVELHSICKTHTTDTGPLTVPLNGSVSLQARTSPPGMSFSRDQPPTWRIASKPDGATVGFGTGLAPTTSGIIVTVGGFSHYGAYTIEARYKDGEPKSIEIQVPGVKIITPGDWFLKCVNPSLPEDGWVTAIGYPDGGSFQWSLTCPGTGQATIAETITDAQRSHVRISPTVPSAPTEEGNIELRVKYTVGTSSHDDTRAISVIKPDSMTCIYGTVNEGDFPDRMFYHQVLDQFEHVIELELPGVEEVQWTGEGQRSSPRLNNGPIAQYAGDPPWLGGWAIQDHCQFESKLIIYTVQKQRITVSGGLMSPYYNIKFDRGAGEQDREQYVTKTNRNDW
jgi:hypothetical protein